jgi:uncharacterized membrane protein YhiD involved in acid resistance
MKPHRVIASLLVGLGIGIAIGRRLAESGLVIAAVAVLVGLVLAAIGPRAPRDPNAPTLNQLGTRVEQILRVTEEQGAASKAAAQREADEIVAAARAEAARIKDA